MTDKKLPMIDTDSAYKQLATGIAELLTNARQQAARSINAVLAATYWETGRRIVEFEQGGKKRAGYGEVLLERLADYLTDKLGRGFSRQNLQQMRQFYLTRSSDQICQTLSGKLTPTTVARIFTLSWSHYTRLMSVKNAAASRFYETEALRGGWSVRQLDRQIQSMFYERTALSRNKADMLKKGARAAPHDVVTPEEEIKDPYVLEFLNLKDEYSENDLEAALIRHLESFLLELGSDFAFMARQKRLRVGNEWYRVDLVFYHRQLRCLVLIDLKIGKFMHADAGQMHMYLNYAREHWTHSNENPPVGLILCAEKDHAVAHYALGNLPNKVLASEYKTTLPDEKAIAREIRKTRLVLDAGRLNQNRLG
jgi:predicted nuclease of restriction endonuclease-like (RecB) superfamily